MPYYIYNVHPNKRLELVTEFENFKEAKLFAREKRSKLTEDDDHTVKVMFADDTAQAEKDLLQHREAPILMEHEK